MSHLESRDVGSFDDRIDDRPPAVSASTVARRQICLNQPVTGSAIFLKAPGGISQVNENANIFAELDGPANQLHHRRAGQRFP
jgi:ABC-type phosphonate transport system ATPase subunit